MLLKPSGKRAVLKSSVQPLKLLDFIGRKLLPILSFALDYSSYHPSQLLAGFWIFLTQGIEETSDERPCLRLAQHHGEIPGSIGEVNTDLGHAALDNVLQLVDCGLNTFESFTLILGPPLPLGQFVRQRITSHTGRLPIAHLCESPHGQTRQCWPVLLEHLIDDGEPLQVWHSGAAEKDLKPCDELRCSVVGPRLVLGFREQSESQNRGTEG